MNRILIAGAFALALGGPVLAADLPPPAAPPPRAPATYVPAPAPYYNWGGIYFGVNGGGVFGNSAWNVPAPGVATGNFTTTGFLVGGTLGANFQAGAFVFGVEGDFDWDNLSGNTSAGSCGIAPIASCTTAQNYLGTARARVGYAWDRILLYGTGGGAFGNIKASATGTGNSNSNNFGWTAGAGIEFAFAQNWTAKAEYLYVSLQNGSCSAANCGVSIPVSLNENIARIGVNYKFNF
jgi:outer membrane immunogenic protein